MPSVGFAIHQQSTTARPARAALTQHNPCHPSRSFTGRRVSTTSSSVRVSKVRPISAVASRARAPGHNPSVAGLARHMPPTAAHTPPSLSPAPRAQPTGSVKVYAGEKPLNSTGQKAHKGRWRSIDVDVDQSDDQVRARPAPGWWWWRW